MNFHNFFNIYVFEVKKSISDIPTELPCSVDLENLNQRPVRMLPRSTDDCVLWIFTNIFIIYVFMVRESFAVISIELPCFGDPKNPESLPVQAFFKVTHTTYLLRNVSNGFFDLKNMNCEKIMKISKTQSSKPPSTSKSSKYGCLV